MNKVYNKVLEFKKKYSLTIAWRLKANSKVIEKHLNPNEEVIYAFACQKNDNPLDIITTCIVALTNKRLLIGRKRVVFGYFFNAVTPDLFNDLEVYSGIIYGKIKIDTIKEEIYLSNISKKALNEIETNITEFMMSEKQKYKQQ